MNLRPFTSEVSVSRQACLLCVVRQYGCASASCCCDLLVASDVSIPAHFSLIIPEIVYSPCTFTVAHTHIEDYHYNNMSPVFCLSVCFHIPILHMEIIFLLIACHLLIKPSDQMSLKTHGSVCARSQREKNKISCIPDSMPYAHIWQLLKDFITL